nr:SUKH-4 family immunity protein [Treponema sp.]
MNIYDFLQNRFKLNTRKDYNNFDLTENTKKILCDIGLPKEPLGFIKFNIDELKTLKHEDDFVIIGTDLGTNICINKNGEIISVDFENEYPTRLINKNLESFLHFIVVFLLHEDEINSADDDTISQIIQKIKAEFEQIDELALNNQENWWPIILEQIETGMM